MIRCKKPYKWWPMPFEFCPQNQTLAAKDF
jgi:hypothetical protein